jgi:antitoxin ParD1/3/4
MPVKPTVSLTAEASELARGLVVSGRFASVSAVVEHGLRLVEREEAQRGGRLAAICADLERRAGQVSISVEEMDARLAAWRAERDGGGAGDLA